MLPVVSADAEQRFRSLVLRTGRRPDDPWIGGYVAQQWNGGRHIIEAREGTLAGKTALEFGCNYGSTCIVLAAMGARVCGVDSDAALLPIARANAARFGLAEDVLLACCSASGRLPFRDAAFDLVVCNSVLEYVASGDLATVQHEVDRVLKPGGRLFIMGTSNRLAAREVHSRRWFVNYLPSCLDRWLGFASGRQRGVSPWRMRYGFGSHYENLDWLDRGHAYVEARRRFPGRWMPGIRIANRIARLCGTSLGLLTPSISVTLRKSDASGIART